MPFDRIALPLFVPATRMDRFAKASRSGADAVIVDLEDAVAPDAKAKARASLLRDMPQHPECPVLVRINAADSAHFDADVDACRGLPLVAIVLPKTEDPKVCADLSAHTGLPVVGLIESARGLHHVHAVAQACGHLAFGSIDFAADLGLAHDQAPLLFARAQIILAARLNGQAAPWDGVTMAVNDEAAILQDCRHSVAMGFGGKLIIHPAQIAPARRGFAPTQQERDWAERVLEATRASVAAIKVDGQMIDAPVIKRAEAILARGTAA
jgi:citrate lyase subunit beta / citryl-CoA lyase